MKLLTHNMLTSKCMRGVNVGYPLTINASDVRVSDVDFNPDFISKLIPKVDWPALYEAARSVGQSEDLPPQAPDDFETNEEFLKKAHRALLEIEIIDGELICPESGRKFPINNGIPNMLLNEDEI
ncbi:uncharacterized protein LOC126736439 isoform X2 [Anthonomus grandis grandis]|uniref:uncharacterized protein LOC126736439 isoform X2 n=1 Tax=Anthonomus grandis grandis TaxID=2921223 RepID=UPI002166728A|nr:uncharacterized protein LOC126736439 isoform X2 [Anthonomus grandis grandis]